MEDESKKASVAFCHYLVLVIAGKLNLGSIILGLLDFSFCPAKPVSLTCREKESKVVGFPLSLSSHLAVPHFVCEGTGGVRKLLLTTGGTCSTNAGV